MMQENPKAMLGDCCRRLQTLDSETWDRCPAGAAFVRHLAYEALFIEQANGHLSGPSVRMLIKDYVVFWTRMGAFFERHPSLLNRHGDPRGNVPVVDHAWPPTPYSLVLYYDSSYSTRVGAPSPASAYDYLVNDSAYGVIPMRSHCEPTWRAMFNAVLCMVECRIMASIKERPIVPAALFAPPYQEPTHGPPTMAHIVVAPTARSGRRPVFCHFDRKNVFYGMVNADGSLGTAMVLAFAMAPFAHRALGAIGPVDGSLETEHVDNWIRRCVVDRLMPLLGLLAHHGATRLVDMRRCGPYYHDLPHALFRSVLGEYPYLYGDTFTVADDTHRGDGFHLLSVTINDFWRLLTCASTLLTAVRVWIHPSTLRERAASVVAHTQSQSAEAEVNVDNDGHDNARPAKRRRSLYRPLCEDLESMVQGYVLWHSLCGGVPVSDDSWARMARVLGMEDVPGTERASKFDVSVAMARQWTPNTLLF